MRVLVVILVAMVVAAAVFIFLSLTAHRSLEPAGAEGFDRDRINVMEQELADMRQNFEHLNAAVESLGADVEAIAQSINDAALNPEPVPSEPEQGTDKPPVVEPIDEPGSLRQLVRDEIKRAEEERKKRIEEERKARMPEDWEKEEFKELAWQVHSTGNKLGLSKAQKRQYFTIVKEHSDRIRSLWKELREKNPGTDMRELSKLYQEQSKDMLTTTRRLVSDILTKEQRKKYDKECENNSWFK